MHRIAIGCDPNAMEEKMALIKFLTAKGYEVTFTTLHSLSCVLKYTPAPLTYFST